MMVFIKIYFILLTEMLSAHYFKNTIIEILNMIVI